MAAPLDSPSIVSQLEGNSEEFDLRSAIDTIALHWKVATSAFLTTVILGAAYAFLAPSVYGSDALIQVEERKGTTLPGLQQLATVLDVDQSPTLGEIEIIKSREVLGAAISALHLSIDVEVRNRVPFFASSYERTMGGMGISLAPAGFGLNTLAWGGEAAELTEFRVPPTFIDKKFILLIDSGDAWTLVGPDKTILAHGRVGVLQDFNLGGSSGSIFVKSVLARVGESFTLISRSENETYKAILRQIKVSETVKQSAIIKVSGEAHDPRAAAALISQIANGYLLQNVSRRSEEAEKSLTFLNAQLPQLKLNVENAEKAFNERRLARQSVNLDKESESLLTRSVDLEKQRIEMELRRQDLTQRFQTSNPDVVTLDSQLGSVRQEESRLTEEIKRLPETEQELLRLDRDVKVNTDLYISLLNNAQQLQVAKAGTIGNVRIIDLPIVDDRPIRPLRGIILAVSATVGLVLGLILAFIARALRPTLRNPDEIERLTGLSTYANVPNSGTQKSLSAKRHTRLVSKGGGASVLEAASPHDPAIEALRSMRMGLQFAIGNSENRVICVTGPLPSLGKTFIATNLAAVLASSGESVLLIDADLRRPTAHEYFGIRRSPGLSEVLALNSTFEAAVHHNVAPNLDVLAAGVSPPNPSELLLRPKLKELFDFASARYRYVIIDTAPILPVGDTLAICKRAAATFMVLRAGESTMEHFADTIRRLETSGIRPTGLIFNGIKLSRLGYGSRYQYGYAAY